MIFSTTKAPVTYKWRWREWYRLVSGPHVDLGHICSLSKTRGPPPVNDQTINDLPFKSGKFDKMSQFKSQSGGGLCRMISVQQCLYVVISVLRSFPFYFLIRAIHLKRVPVLRSRSRLPMSNTQTAHFCHIWFSINFSFFIDLKNICVWVSANICPHHFQWVQAVKPIIRKSCAVSHFPFQSTPLSSG